MKNIHDRGFNLIEILTTITIMGLFTVMALPSFKALIQQLRVDSNLRTIKQSVAFARNMAINYGARVTMCPLKQDKCAKEWQNGFTIFIDKGKSNQLDANDTLLLSISQFHQEDIIQYNRKAIRFQPDGLASGTNGTLTYCPEDYTSPYSQALVINQAGKARYSTKKTITCKAP